MSLVAGCHAATARRARRRCSATCASSGPTRMLAPPRIWENMLTAHAGQGGRRLAAQAPRVRVFPRRWPSAASCCAADGKPIAARRRGSACALGEFFVYGPVRDQLGLRNARWCYTGGAPLGPDTFRFFRSFGVNLKQVYGATEASALIACQADAEANPNTVGRPMPGHRGQDRRARRGAW